MPHEEEIKLAELIGQYRAENLPARLKAVLSDFISYRKPNQAVSMLKSNDGLDFAENEQGVSRELDLEPSTVFVSGTSTMALPVGELEGIPKRVEANEEKHFDEFFARGCGCQNRCHTRFPKVTAITARLDSLGLDLFSSCHINHQHLALFGTLNALLVGSEARPRRKKSHERIKAHTNFHFRGRQVCQRFFLYVNGCGLRRLRNMQAQFQATGLQPRPHENTTKMQSLAAHSPQQQRRLVLTFVQNYAEANSLQLPARWQESATDVRCLYYLPTQASITRRSVFDCYIEACRLQHYPSISYSLFSELWRLHFPNVLLSEEDAQAREPCRECRLFSQSLVGSNENKMQVMQSHLEHLREMSTEMDDYFQAIECATTSFEAQQEKRPFEIGADGHPLINDLSEMHYTLDWYTTISLPNLNTRKTLPAYFEAGYKVALFGVAIEPSGKYVLYIVPESVFHEQQQMGNLTLSILDHFHHHYRYYEKETIIHVANDSTSGLRSSLFLSYLMWRTLQGHAEHTRVSFLPAPHAQTRNDLVQGVLTKGLRRAELSSLAELKNLAETLFLRELNDEHGKWKIEIEVHLVADDHGRVSVPILDWQQKLALFRQLNADTVMAAMRHFEINAELPGFVLCRRRIGGEVVSYQIFCIENLPVIDGGECDMVGIKLSPLSDERRTYIREKIIPFVGKEYRSLAIWDFGAPDEKLICEERSIKKRRKSNAHCSYCGVKGHREMTFGRITCEERKRDSELLAERKKAKVTIEQLEDEVEVQSHLDSDNINVVIEEP